MWDASKMRALPLKLAAFNPSSVSSTCFLPRRSRNEKTLLTFLHISPLSSIGVKSDGVWNCRHLVEMVQVTWWSDFQSFNLRYQVSACSAKWVKEKWWNNVKEILKYTNVGKMKIGRGRWRNRRKEIRIQLCFIFALRTKRKKGIYLKSSKSWFML